MINKSLVIRELRNGKNGMEEMTNQAEHTTWRRHSFFHSNLNSVWHLDREINNRNFFISMKFFKLMNFNIHDKLSTIKYKFLVIFALDNLCCDNAGRVCRLALLRKWREIKATTCWQSRLYSWSWQHFALLSLNGITTNY